MVKVMNTEKTTEEKMLAYMEEQKNKEKFKAIIAGIIFFPFLLFAGFIVFIASSIS